MVSPSRALTGGGGASLMIDTKSSAECTTVAVSTGFCLLHGPLPPAWSPVDNGAAAKTGDHDYFITGCEFRSLGCLLRSGRFWLYCLYYFSFLDGIGITV